MRLIFLHGLIGFHSKNLIPGSSRGISEKLNSTFSIDKVDNYGCTLACISKFIVISAYLSNLSTMYT